MTGIERMRGRRQGLVLQQRDRELLSQLSLMRVADRDQLKVAAGFASITRINTRLLALYRAGVMRRFFIGSGGGRKALYALSQKGAQLIGVPCRGPRRRTDELLVTDFSVLHQLAINDVYCNVRFGAILVAGVHFVNWLAFTEPITRDLRLIPDGYVEFTTAAGIDGSFVEVDLGNEALGVWKEKTARYLKFATSGEYSRQFRHPRFRVLVIAHSARRLHSIRAAVAEITQKIFWFATIDDARGRQFFGPDWFRPVGQHPQPLFEIPR
jgi:hypothetical protein